MAFSYDNNRGFATEGSGASVAMFDLKTLQVLGHIPAADDADAIVFDPATHRVYLGTAPSGQESFNVIALDRK